MRGRLPLVLALWVATSSVAQEASPSESPVEHYTHGISVSLLSGASFLGSGGTSGAFNIVAAGGGAVYSVTLGLDARVSIFGFLVDPSLGVYFGLLGPAVIITPGIGLGYAIGLTSHLALSPMVRASFLIQTGGNSVVQTTVTGEVPLTIFLGRNGFMEPYVGAGASILASQVVFAFTFGYRLGVTF